MKRAWIGLGVALLVLQAIAPCPTVADEGLIAGAEVGGAFAEGHFRDRAHSGATLSPFVGYMLTDNVGLVGEAQLTGFPAKDGPNGLGSGTPLVLGFHAGPRLAFPFTLLGRQLEPYGTFQPGVFTGLQGDSAVSRTSWGFSTGGGLNVRLTDEWLLGGFARYNWLDQRAIPGADVGYVTAGVAVTYNVAKPPPPPVVAAAPPPPPRPAPAPKRKIVLRGVHFDFDKAVIRNDARPVLDEAVATLKRERGIAIIAEGHTDSMGSNAYNLKLSQRRAAAVRDYLVAGGISADRIQVVGYGESHPVASNETEGGRAQNRRVELRIRGQ